MRHRHNGNGDGNSKLMQFIAGAEEYIEAERKRQEITARIVYLMQRYPSCKGNDTELQIRYWMEFEQDKIHIQLRSFDKMMALTKHESLARLRRFVQAKGVIVDGRLEQFLPEPETVSRHRAKAVIMKRLMVGAGV